MIVDIYTHILPASFADTLEGMGARFGLVKRLRTVRELHDLDQRFRTMDRFGEYRQIVSLPNPPIEAFTSPEEGARIARLGNDAMAEIVRRHSDRFPAFVAAVAMHDMDAAMAELERAVGELGARGVQIFSNVNGRPLDDPEFRPLFARMAEYDLPVFLHPARSAETPDYAAEPFSRYEMWWCFGWPYETSVAMARLVLSGLFDQYPGLKIVTHHLGGMIPYFDKRIEQGLAVLGSRTREEDYSGLLKSLRRPLIEYFGMFYADTALFGASHGLRCGLEFFGPDRVVFASDAPFGPIGDTRDAIADLGLGDGARAALESGNAEKLLGMSFA